MPGYIPLPNSQMALFRAFVNEKLGLKLENYGQLYEWSTKQLAEFWKLFVEFSKIKFLKPYEKSVENENDFFQVKWFPGGEINLAQNALRFADNTPILFAQTENRFHESYTGSQLKSGAAYLAGVLRNSGALKGSRIAAYLPNEAEALIVLLSSFWNGCVFSSSSPDFGAKAVNDRYLQYKPQILFTTTGYMYKGKFISLIEKLEQIIQDTPTLKNVFYFRHKADDSQRKIQSPIAQEICIDFSCEDYPEYTGITFSDPVFVMYSSGTTGLPKCIVQGAGVFINHHKEHILHTNLNASDNIFYYSTCGWMMWNWHMSALATGSQMSIFDGNPFYPGPEILWEMARKNKVTVFGTSAKYLMTLQLEKFKPGKHFALGNLRTILSTGSVLPAESFKYIYSEIKSDVQICSISGGTDLNGCFALGNPELPVIDGQLQCRGLGLDVDIVNERGESVKNETGELICKKPFPSQPLYFLDDKDQSRYRAAYFEKYSGIWCHGDFAELTGQGGIIIHGRSDATLNPGGVRIGTAEIYRVTESIPFIEDSVAVSHEKKGDTEIILFVKTSDGKLSDPQIMQIKKIIKDTLSPRHVPARILACPDIPMTLNGKKSEIAVRDLLHGRAIKNEAALANPECLAFYKKVTLD